jgi:hypothetical protein
MAKNKNTTPPAEGTDQQAPPPAAVDSIHPQVGDTVLFVLPEHDRKGTIRPAIVVQVFKRQDEGMPLINVQQFTDGHYDITDHPVAPTTIWRTSLHHDQAGKQPGTWHWPTADNDHG